MNINTNQQHDAAEDILAAMRKIQDTPELQAEAQTNPESLMNRLGLSGVARHAVAFALTAVLTGPGVIQSLAHPNNFWH